MKWSRSGQVTDYRSTAASTKTARECERVCTWRTGCWGIGSSRGASTLTRRPLPCPSDTSTAQVQEWCPKETPRRFWPASACRMITDRFKTAGRDFPLPWIEVRARCLWRAEPPLKPGHRRQRAPENKALLFRALQSVREYARLGEENGT